MQNVTKGKKRDKNKKTLKTFSHLCYVLYSGIRALFPIIYAFAIIVQGCKRDVAVQDRDDTETFDFKFETRPRPSKILSRPRRDLPFRDTETETFRTETETFLETLHTSECFFEATTTMTSSIHALMHYNWNKHHKSYWHYQDFTHHISSNQIGQHCH